jgi:hypothetical protein
MLSYLYELLISLVTYILGFLGIDTKKKSVTFADEVESNNTNESVPSSEASATPTESAQSAESAQ